MKLLYIFCFYYYSCLNIQAWCLKPAGQIQHQVLTLKKTVFLHIVLAQCCLRSWKAELLFIIKGFYILNRKYPFLTWEREGEIFIFSTADESVMMWSSQVFTCFNSTQTKETSVDWGVIVQINQDKESVSSQHDFMSTFLFSLVFFFCSAQPLYHQYQLLF